VVTVEKIQSGLVKFIDRELAPSLTGWDRVIIAGGSGLVAANLPNILAKYAGNPAMEALGIVDKENNRINIDALYKAAAPYIGDERLPVKIPYIGVTVKIGKSEIDTLYKYIKEE